METSQSRRGCCCDYYVMSEKLCRVHKAHTESEPESDRKKADLLAIIELDDDDDDEYSCLRI